MTTPLKLEESALAHYLPWWWIGDRVLVLVDGAIAVGFELTGVDIGSQPDEALNQIARQIRGLLNAVPPGYQLQFIRRSRAVERSAFDSYLRAINTVDPVLREQRRRSAEHLAASNLRRFESYLLGLEAPRAGGARLAPAERRGRAGRATVRTARSAFDHAGRARGGRGGPAAPLRDDRPLPRWHGVGRGASTTRTSSDSVTPS